MQPCPPAGVNASLLRVGKDLVQEGISGRLENCSVGFLGLGGRRDGELWYWFCRGRQGWVSFQMNWFCDLTQCVVQTVVLSEGR